MPFTPAGAWEFIMELLKDGHPIEAIELDFPPGCTGYVLKVPETAKQAEIYIKLELGPGGVWGRSFHYSEKDRRP